MATASVDWTLWSTTARLVVTEPAALPDARVLADSYLQQVDDAANRFRDDSEIVNLDPGQDGWVQLSPVLGDLMAEALGAAELTDGDVDPTVGAAMRRLGYDRDLELVTQNGTPIKALIRPAPGWRRLTLNGRGLNMPPGVVLDLGATAKAVAADRVAALVHRELGVGVLISLGGDIATAGAPPYGGWQVQVQDRPEDPVTQVTLPSSTAIATSSTVSRQWTRGDRKIHHILDPRTGLPADPVWRSVTVAAGTCVRANAVSTAAVIRGESALRWVEGLRLPARFLGQGGRVVTTSGWPQADAA